MRRSRRRSALKCLLTLLALLLVACGGRVDETVPVERPSRPAGTATPLPSASPTAATTSATLSGTVLSASDVSSQPDVPLPDQLLLLLPAAQARDLLGVSQLTEEALRFLSTTIAEVAPGMSTLRSGPDGGFRTTLAGGAYVLCLADAEGSSRAAPPYQTRGCAPLTLQAGETVTVEVSTMFGEIVLTPMP